MAIASLKDLYLDELGDLYDAETQIIRHLPRLAEQAHTPELREALMKHCDESRLHLERLELIFTHWSERRRSRPCAALAGIVQEADDRLVQVTTDDARDAAIIGVAQRIEHYEIAAYGCARTYARRLNRTDEARLLHETLQDEGRADGRLTEIAEAHVNDDARGELDLQAPSVSMLRFVRADARQSLTVRHGANEDLGRFAGALVEAPDRPRYVVVDSGGLFAHRRYLLPMEDVRYDAGASVLRVDVARDIAERYPSFDPDAFQAMSDAERRIFGTRLLERFPRASAAATSDFSTGEAPPEWLMTAATANSL
jgi:ferritin-like metal-binding protein YciE